MSEKAVARRTEERTIAAVGELTEVSSGEKIVGLGSGNVCIKFGGGGSETVWTWRLTE